MRVSGPEGGIKRGLSKWSSYYLKRRGRRVKFFHAVVYKFCE